ncbi:uncharacterized protein LOC114355503 isoform X1 [Ostrinia furnacalis]|uniref:uncharacterized protein LOC114355503 isoform X1 n=1 Tax=Ostrinia furnacalis TaxID=93504 RepID=UPI00103F8F9E|nr:uncharacterized protein LOC114355503 isoform X1 [Ostrinia furnacalis]
MVTKTGVKMDHHQLGINKEETRDGMGVEVEMVKATGIKEIGPMGQAGGMAMAEDLGPTEGGITNPRHEAFKAELLENQLISKRTSRKLWKKTQETHFVRNDRRVNYAIGCLGRRKAERCNKQQHDGAAEW